MSPRRDHARADSGNVPGNPLRSYRMSMLAHGFLQDEARTGEMRPDANQSLTYSVGPLRRRTSLMRPLVALFVILALFAIAVLLFA